MSKHLFRAALFAASLPPRTLAVAGAALVATALVAPLPAAFAAPQKVADGVVIPLNGAYLKLSVLSDDVIRVSTAKNPAFFNRRGLMTVAPQPVTAKWKLKSNAKTATLSTSQLQVRVDLTTGTVTFFDAKGQPIAREKVGGRVIEAAQVAGENTNHVRQEWEGSPDESLYGLGQNQLGITDIKGYDLELWQRNTNVDVPFLVSSKGYGILWDNTSYTRFGDLRQNTPIPADQLFDATGKPGGLTGSYFAGAAFGATPAATRVDPIINIQGRFPEPTAISLPEGVTPRGDLSVRWEGTLVPKQSGDHIFDTFTNGDVKLFIDDKPLINHWRQSWLPSDDVARVRLEAGKSYKIRVEWLRNQGANTFKLGWKTPTTQTATSLWSEVGDGVDYYFVYGPKIDKVIGGYRRITGKAALMPNWSFGLWQSRQRYETAQQSLDVLDQFRARKIPFDNIVQDWQYWPRDAWGSHKFDPVRFPEPQKWIDEIHAKNAHLMISVWGKFYTGTDNFNEMNSKGYLYQPNLQQGLKDWIGFPYTFYDAFNPDARKLFWSQMDKGLFSKGIDAWWMDATEPDLLAVPNLEGHKANMAPTAGGTGARALNGYPLVNSQAIYEGQRSSKPNQRVFNLTRSGFAGQQRYGAATWSGDVTSTWTALAKQIPAALGFSISGVPYWTMDIGGYALPPRFANRNRSAEETEEWRELNARWFQFGTFVPITRVHGEGVNREVWEIAPDTHPMYQTELKFDRLRYRMLPYIYSVAGAVTQQDSSFLRPLVMDFPADARAREVSDQYLFGPAFLVSPVTTFGARNRPVYLPSGTNWYDFWTGRAMAGGQTYLADAPYESMPLSIRAGSIIPFGPEKQYVAEKPSDPTTLYVYAGADGQFSIYEDEGTNYSYEKGAFSTIPLTWNDKSKTLSIGKRTGAFPGMLTTRTFNIVMVSPSKPVGFAFEPQIDKSVTYAGAAMKVKLAVK